MKVIIDIPEVFYEALRKTDEIISGQRSGKTLMSVIYNAVANGTPLPKGHGELIDRDKIEYLKAIHDAKYGHITWSDASKLIKYSAPTIIEADKAESEDKE